MLPAALAVALSPFPLIGIVVILAGRQGRRNGLLFAAGWITGLGIVATLVVVVFGGADDPESSSSAIANWGRVLDAEAAEEGLTANSGRHPPPWRRCLTATAVPAC
ncbi:MULTISPECIES: GAP family protein [unclassified Streptomyces]|uniref:GAP family protein n=1 Tax=unclassified Streptomyces TaxID=2593676 RepID=UPI00386D81B8